MRGPLRGLAMRGRMTAGDPPPPRADGGSACGRTQGILAADQEGAVHAPPPQVAGPRGARAVLVVRPAHDITGSRVCVCAAGPGSRSSLDTAIRP